MIATRQVSVTQQQLMSRIHQEGCEVIQNKSGRLTIRAPGMDLKLLTWLDGTFIRNFWDQFEITPVFKDGRTAYRLELNYFTPFNLGIHLVFTALVFMEAIAPHEASFSQLMLFLFFSNLLLPVSSWIQARALFRKLEQ